MRDSETEEGLLIEKKLKTAKEVSLEGPFPPLPEMGLQGSD
jgi:hypothetical protein